MKKYKILLVGVLILSQWLISFSQPVPKDLMWIRGSKATSVGWNRVDAHLTLSFNYRDVLDQTYTNFYPQGFTPTANFMNQQIDLWNGDLVLGIAHGYGGLALREAQLSNPKIDAMILNGVPNQGSRMIEFLTEIDGNGESDLHKLIKKIKKQVDANKCQDCDVFGLWKDWADELKNSSSWLKGMSKRNISYFNNISNPTVPTIVMYGLIDRNSYGSFAARFMDSHGSHTGTSILEKCYDDKLREETRKQKHSYQISTINNVANWFVTALKLVGNAIKNPVDGLGGSLTLIAETIDNHRRTILAQIEANFKNNEELSRMLKCRLAHQVFEAEWFLLMGPGDVEEGIKEITVEVIGGDYNSSELYECLAECELQYGNSSYPNDIFLCSSDCYQHYYTQSSSTIIYQTFYTYIPEPSDGLFTQSEMQLPNASAEIIMQGVDHFGETRIDNVDGIFRNQIFNGASGNKFLVPLR